MEKKQLKPFLNTGPGQILKREMEALNWSQSDLAEIIGMDIKSINQIANNKQSITIDTARLLAKAFSSSPEFWMNLEQNYRLRLKKEDSKESEAATKAEIRKHLPLGEMKKKGWVTYTNSASSQEKAYCDFWHQKSPDFSVYEQKPPYHARKPEDDFDFTRNYSITWLQKAHIEARKMAKQPCPYGATHLENLAQEIPAYSLKPGGVKEFIQDLCKTGVYFFVLSPLPKTHLDGAAFQYENKKYIVYTARHNRVDHFWLTMAHEIAHLLKHVKTENDCFIDNLDEPPADKKEKEADQLADQWRQVDHMLKLAKPYKKYFSRGRLDEISKQVKIEESLIVGALQQHEIISRRTLNEYKKEVLPLIPARYIRG